MNIKTVLLCAFAVLCTQTGLVWSGPIYKTVPMIPSDLNTPLAKPGTGYMYTYIGCVNAATGIFVSCGYDFSIIRLAQPNSGVANNGGHTHTYADHPLGKLKVIWPVGGTLSGETKNNYVYFSHEIPKVSGKIETVLNLRVPLGWYTVSPESCNGNGTSWCFMTTVDVGEKNLTPLPDAPLYTKARSPDTAHTDAVAFYGTDSALRNLTSIAAVYNRVFGRTLSVNDMSLIKGGLFDVYGDYSPPHQGHRTGESVDINKIENGDCTKNKALLISVYIVMGRAGSQIFANRTLPSFGHFLCETNNKNRIHIDL